MVCAGKGKGWFGILSLVVVVMVDGYGIVDNGGGGGGNVYW